MSTSIKFFYLKPLPELRERKKLKAYLPDLFESEKKKLANLTYIFCSDQYLLKINQENLKHDFYTDIITFDLSSEEKKIEGEIYISIDRVRDNAHRLGVSFKEEIHRVVFHGALHLCGYKDKNKHDKIEMSAKEDKHLAIYLGSTNHSSQKEHRV